MSDLPFQSFTIGQFRGLRDLVLDGCRPINILVGSNNSGKTSVLEALILSASPTDVEQWEEAVQLRRAWPLIDRRANGVSGRLDTLSWLFPHQGDRQMMSIEVSGLGLANDFVATPERINAVPPSQPISSPEEMIEARWDRPQTDLYRSGQQSLFESRQQTLFDGPRSETGLSIDLVVNRSTVHDSESPESSHFRMVLWEGGGYRPQASLAVTLPIAFATPISHRSDGYLATQVGRLLRSKSKLSSVLNLLQKIDPLLADLVMVSPEDSERDGPMPRHFFGPTLHVGHSEAGLIPIHAAGDGVRRAIHYAALLADLGPGGVLLIDEIEVGMHTSVLRDVFSWLGKACREASIQLFATTHSLEAVDAILEGVPDEDLALYRLQDGEARRYAGELLRTARVELGQEVR